MYNNNKNLSRDAGDKKRKKEEKGGNSENIHVWRNLYRDEINFVNKEIGEFIEKNEYGDEIDGW